MEKIGFEGNDFMNYCDYKNLLKNMKSYEQTLRLFIRYLKHRNEEQHIKEYFANIKESGKYTIFADDNTKKDNRHKR